MRPLGGKISKFYIKKFKVQTDPLRECEKSVETKKQRANKERAK